MMNILSKSGEILRYAGEELRNDKEFMLQAIEIIQKETVKLALEPLRI